MERPAARTVSDSFPSTESILSDSITGVSIEGNPDDGLDGPVVRGRGHAVADAEIERPGLALDFHHRIQLSFLRPARHPVPDRPALPAFLAPKPQPFTSVSP